MDRALVSGTKGRAFESRIAHHQIKSGRLFSEDNVNDLVRSPKSPFSVIPAKAGIQFIHRLTKHLDSGDPVPAKAENRSDDFLP